LSAGALRGGDDFARLLVEHAMVERLQADSDLLSIHGPMPLHFLNRAAANAAKILKMKTGTEPAKTAPPPYSADP